MQTNTDIHAAAAALGRMGGRSRSAAKVAAVRANGAKGGRPRDLAVDVRAFERRCEKVGDMLARDELAARRHAAGLSPTLPPVPRRFPLGPSAVAERLAAGVPVRDFWDAPRLRELDDAGRCRVLEAAGRPDYLSRVLAAARAAWAERCGR